MVKPKNISQRYLAIICLILFLTFLDNTIVSVALFSIQSTLRVGVINLQWVVDAYMLVFAVFMLSGGTLGDRLGRKKIMLAGVLLFSIGSFIAMLAPSVNWLIAGRIVMGLGAAASEPGTLSMIRQIYKNKKQRAKALGVWAAVSGIALAFGPIIGGLLISFSNWRAIFAFSSVLGIISLFTGFLYLPNDHLKNNNSFDYIGLILGGLGLSFITGGLIEGENYGYLQPVIIFLLVIGLVLLFSFIVIENLIKQPVLPMNFFKNKNFALANLIAFSTNFAIFAVFFFVSLYLQLIAGFSGYQLVLVFISISVAMVISALATGRVNSTNKKVPLEMFGCIVAAIGVYLVNIMLSPKIGLIELSASLFITGLGFGICLTGMTNSVLNSTPVNKSGIAASTVNTFREVGGVFSVALLGLIVNSKLTTGLRHRLYAFHLPTNFQSFVIYAVTHGGHTPQSAHISVKELISHASLINKLTIAAYRAFGSGLNVSLDIASSLLLITGVVSIMVFYLYDMKARTLKKFLNII